MEVRGAHVVGRSRQRDQEVTRKYVLYVARVDEYVRERRGGVTDVLSAFQFREQLRD